MTQFREPYDGEGEVDESTAVSERRHAVARVEEARHGEIRSNAILAELSALVAGISEMHRENHYVERLRPIWQGGHRD